MQAPSVLDLFSGACGGWSLGMHRAGYETIAACEFDPWRRAVFAQNFPNVRMYDDVRTLTADRLLADLGRLPDVVVGSPPCQDASAANTSGKGLDGERTGLFFDAIRIVGECRPRFAAFENVPGIRTRGVDRVFDALEEIGYACEPYVVGADDIGAPHERKRAWFIAVDATSVGSHGRGAWGRWAQGHAHTPTEDHALNATEIGWGTRRAGRPDSGIAGPSDAAWREPASADAGCARRQERNGSKPGEPEIPESLRHVATDWADWNGGLGRNLRVGHGLPTGMARACISAYGDAVVPQITEAIGRAIWRTERALAAVYGRDAA